MIIKPHSILASNFHLLDGESLQLLLTLSSLPAFIIDTYHYYISEFFYRVQQVII